MTVEFHYLLLATILATLSWIPYVVGFMLFNTPDGVKASFVEPADIRSFPPWIQRCYRGHQNLIEQFAPFAVAIICAHLLGVSTGITRAAAGAYFYLRLAHLVVMIVGFSRFPLRSIIFHAAWLCILLIVWQVFAMAGAA